MMTRSAKLLLLAGIAVYYTFVVFNNLTDFNSNYEFIRHVLSMDSTFPGNHAMWRALPWPAVHLVSYWLIIAWEFATGVLAWWGVVCLTRTARGPASEFNAGKRVAVAALTLSLLMWLVAFLDVGGEWFLMWQSHTWNGQEEAFRMFVIVGFVLLLLLQPDTEAQV
jgi:predicted small integral membrane protein